MKSFIFLALVYVVLAKDCGQFSCACNSQSKSSLSFLVTNDENSKASTLARTYSYFETDSCEGNVMYEHLTDYALTFVKEEEDTRMYTRKVTSNKLKIVSEKAITELGCEGVSVGNTLDLLNEEDRAKCTTEAFVVPEESEFPMHFDGIVFTNPEQQPEKCEIFSVDICQVIYPERYVLIPMYVLDIVIVVVVVVVYALFFRQGPKTLPITQPQTESQPEVKKEEPVAAEPVSTPVAEEPAIPASVSNLESAASQAASELL